jgi:FkbM family methyltransferase
MNTRLREAIIHSMSRVLSWAPGRAMPLVRAATWGYLQLRASLPPGEPIEIKSDSDWVVFQEIFLQGEYDYAIDATIRHAGAAEWINVVDLGANVGFFSKRLVTRLHGTLRSPPKLRLLLVEGSPPVADELRARFSRTTADQEIRIVQGLVGPTEGFGFIQSNQRFSAVTSVTSEQERHSVKVPYLNLEELTKDMTAVHLLKCDVEGSEFRFLDHNRSWLGKVMSAIFEFHADLCDVPRCMEILKHAGLGQGLFLKGSLSDKRSICFFSR